MASVPDAPADPRSLLHVVRQLIALRKAHPALGASGEFEPLFADREQWPFVFRRSAAGETTLVAVNPTDRSVTATFTHNAVGRGFSPSHSAPTTATTAEAPQSGRPAGALPAPAGVFDLLGHPDAFRRDGATWTVTLPPVSFAIARLAE